MLQQAPTTGGLHETDEGQEKTALSTLPPQIILMTQQKPFQKLTAIPHCGDKAFTAMEDTTRVHKAGT